MKNKQFGKIKKRIKYRFVLLFVIPFLVLLSIIFFQFRELLFNTELYLSVNKFFSIIFLLIVTMIISTYFLIDSLGNRFSIPISDLIDLSSKVVGGDFSVRVENNSYDELGLLTSSINNMIDNLERTKKIEEGVSSIIESIIGIQDLADFRRIILQILIGLNENSSGIFFTMNEINMSFEESNSQMSRQFDTSLTVNNEGGFFSDLLLDENINCLGNYLEFLDLNEIQGHFPGMTLYFQPIKVEEIVIAFVLLISDIPIDEVSCEILVQSRSSVDSFYSKLMANERSNILSEYLLNNLNKLEDQSFLLKDQSLELQKKNDMLNQNRLEIEKVSKLKSEFLTNMSHELRTPLNSIITLSHSIERKNTNLTQEENSYLKIIERNGRQLLNMINDILDLSRIEAGKVDMDRKVVNLSIFLTEVKENFQYLANDKDITFELLLPKKPCFIETDEIKFNQIITNIVSNAVKFTKVGKICLELGLTEKFIYISIRDTGIGISHQNISTIFDQFRQVDGSYSRNFEGTGLGLTIAKRLIDLFGWDISVHSQLGEGSEFRIFIPYGD